MFARRTAKPWGWEICLTPSDAPYVLKLIGVNAGCRLSLQVHSAKTETQTLIGGHASLRLGDETFLMTPGIGYTIPAGLKHRLSALTDAVICEASTPETGVTYRLEDDYARGDEVR